MARQIVSKMLLLAALAGVLGTATGCKTLLVLPPFIGGTIFGYWLAGGQNVTVNVERNCFENGVQVDCSAIPGALTAGVQ